MSASEWQALVDKASGQTVTVYHAASPDQFDRFAEAFNKKYPKITLAQQRGGQPLLTQLQSEIAAGQPGADILVFPAELFFKGALDQFTPLVGPDTATWPAAGYLVPGEIPVVSVLAESVIMWNTGEFPNGFKGFEDALKVPSGRMGLRNAYSGPLCGYYDFLEKYFPGILEEVGKLKPVAYGSTTESAQAVGSGEIGVTIENTPANAISLKKAGAPIDFLVVEKPAFGQPYQAGVFQKAKSPEGAQVMMDFLLTPEGQEAWNGEGFGASYLPNIPTAASTEGWDIFQAADYGKDVVTACGAKIDKVVFGK
jgi:iron(III) transport system substrate-binding protein